MVMLRFVREFVHNDELRQEAQGQKHNQRGVPEVQQPHAYVLEQARWKSLIHVTTVVTEPAYLLSDAA